MTPGANSVTRVYLRRTNVAERLYRVTGEGIYADSVQANSVLSASGRGPERFHIPIAHPELNAGVMGQDSILNAHYQGLSSSALLCMCICMGTHILDDGGDGGGGVTKHTGRDLWVWGDTLSTSYPLGNFHATSAFVSSTDPSIGTQDTNTGRGDSVTHTRCFVHMHGRVCISMCVCVRVL